MSGIKMTICAVAAVLACTASAVEPSTSEEHVERTVGTILSNVAKMKRTDGTIVPMAFWNFDGTIIKGGVAEGLSEDGVECYKGLVEEGILGGWSRTYGGEEGWIRFRDVDYPRLVRLGGQCAWPFNAQIFAGTKASDLDRFCLRKFRETYRKWYFTSSVAILRRLEAAGVENYIISESPEIFIRNAAETLGLDPSRMNAIRVGIDGGRITSRIEEPLPIGDGKVEVMRRIVAARTNAYAVAGFGNSYGSDGPFMRTIVRQDLPGGAKGVAVMINGSGSPEGFEGLFTCVTQTAVGMPAGRWTAAENFKVETGELQSRIDAASAAGGGTVTIGPGLHRAGTLVLRDGVTLRLEKGARLKAVHGKGHYAREDGPAFIWATNAVHVAIEGPGTIDGSGDELPRDRDFSPRPRLVLFEDCRDVRVEDVALRASARWTLALHRVDGFAIRRVDILTHAHYNNDGIDLMAKNGVVEDCTVDSDDDAVVMKTLSPGFTVENVTVRRCRLSSNMNLIKIGTETWGGFRNILVEDVKAEVRTPSAVWPYAVATPNGDPEKPYCKSGIAIMVVDGGTLEDVTVRNVTFVLPGGCTKAMCAHPVPECENGIPTNQMFGFHPLPAHGFYIRHADGVRIENVRCFTRNPDERPAVVRDDAAAVDFDVFVVGGTLKAVRMAVAARGEGRRVFLAAPRPYCGEDRAATLDLERHPEDDVADPLIREIFNPQYRASGAYNVLPAKGWRAVQKFEPYETVETAPVTGTLDTVTTPLLVKRACDRALLAAKIEFLTAAPVIAAERTEDGNWRVTYAVRGGERTVVVREFVDCRLPRRVAKGRHDFSYRVVRGPKPHIETIDFSYDVPTSDARGLLAVENHARSLVGTSNLLDVAEWVTVKDPAETPPVPVDVTCDVVVAGGGTGGGPAAVAAARAGAKTILVEYQNILGGVSSEGRIGGFGSYYDGNVCGFTKELEDGERKLGGAYFFARGEWLRREIVRSGGEVWLGTMVTGAEMSGNRLIGVRVVLPDGTRGLIRCKTAVDATGNSDLAAAAGAKTEFITGDELSLQGCGMAGQPLGAWCVNSDIGFVDETDAADLCFFALRSRLSLPDRVWNQSSLVDSRERRRIVGDFRISPVDLLLNRRYPDVICQARSTFDTHGQTSHPVFFIRDTGKRGDCIRGNIPYRALLPRGVEGLLVTGLGISAHRDAMPVLRMKADIQNQGYAAGLAAALAAKEGLTPRQLNVRRLQERLVSVGNLPDEVLTWEDSLPLSHAALESAVERLSDGYDGLPEILSDPVRALPLLRARPGFERAHVRALLGDLTAAPELIARLEGLSWDEGWDYKGMSQYLRSVGAVDRYVIALGRTHAGAALPVLDRLASELTGESAYSHFRALALAYESIGDPRGAAALRRLLALPGVSGHAWRPGEVRPIPGYSDLPTNKERSDALRELCVARALFRLGDPSGAARRSLESYVDDPRRAFANHARQVLDGGKRVGEMKEDGDGFDVEHF